MIELASPALGAEAHDRISSVLESGRLADGPRVRAFEDAFASYCDARHAVATSNGTTALHTAMEALGLGNGDRVVTTPFSFIASANAVRLAGSEPVFADIDPETYTLDPAAVEATIRDLDGDVDAILAVHLYGLPADMDRLGEIATEYDLWLIEDAAQAHGATVSGTPVGTLGDVGCFSFYPTKNITTGEGGMVVTDDPEIAERAARFVNHGRTDDGSHASVGHNFRMTSLAAAIGSAQLEKLPVFVESRRETAAQLTDALDSTPVTTPTEPAGRTHAYNQYTIRCSDRDGLAAHLSVNDVGHGVYYPRCIHEQPAYAEVSVKAPEAESAASEVISLPVHPDVSAGDAAHIAEVVRRYV